MTEKENKAIEDYKRVIAMYFKYSNYDLFCSNLMKSGVKGTIQNTMADMVNLIEKLQKENEEKTTIILAGAEKVKSLEKKIEELKNKVIKRDNELIELDETSEKEFITKQEVKENYIPKDKIRDFIKRLEKDVENIREKKKDSHDYDRSSSRIQAYLTKTNEIIKRLKELLVED